MQNLSLENIKIHDGFWRFYLDLNRTSVVKNVYDRFRETGRFDALGCNWREGMPGKPHVFWDSDVVKWIEGVAYIIQEAPAPEWETLADEMIDTIAENQRKDGYFNSYFLPVEPSKVFSIRQQHELYCLGHMIEAAIAYHKATGKEKLLQCVLKYLELVYHVFVETGSAGFITPGHEEIELALIKLYHHLGNEKHLQLARFFINQRGTNDKDTPPYNYGIEYAQDNVPVREITEAVGHSVRGAYLYTGMQMLAAVDGDEALKKACDRVFDSIVNYKMAITGGVGADHVGEKFSYHYDLPNSDTYNETCAAIALVLFAGALQEADGDSRYGDVIERVLYNGFLSGVSLDGEKFFYANPLEVDRKKSVRSTYQATGERAKVFQCSCCPPNVVRTLASIGKYMYTVDGNTVYCNQFGSSEAALQIGGKPATLTQVTNYPTDGKITFRYRGQPMTLRVRIPDWCVEYTGQTHNGFAEFSLTDGGCVTVELPMEIHFMEANPYAQDNSGRFAVQRGPIVYCMEELDNGENLRDIRLLEKGAMRVVTEAGIPAPVIYMDAQRRTATKQLYALKNDHFTNFTARLIPYFAFANRDPSDMIVWTMVK